MPWKPDCKHADITAIKGNVEGLQTDVAKMSQEVARLDTMSSRIQSMNLSMHDSNKEVTRVLHYLQETVQPSLDDNKGLLQEMTQSWTELKAALTMLSTQVVEFRKEFGEFRQAMLNSFEDKSKFDGTESEKFRMWTQNQETHFAQMKTALENLNGRFSTGTVEQMVSRALSSDARLHAINTGIVTLRNASGIPINPKQLPLTPQPTPVKPNQPQQQQQQHQQQQQQQQTRPPNAKPPKTSQILAKEKAAQEAAAKAKDERATVNLSQTVAPPPPHVMQAWQTMAAFMGKSMPKMQ